jgi:heme ABC exporter ATP-binding subunit CcmA
LSAEPLVAVRGLTRRFGARTAVDRVDFEVEAGRPLALFGGNGAGKSTLLRLLCGSLRPTQGSISIAGVDPRRAPIASRNAIGLVAHGTLLYDDLSAAENLIFFGKLHGVRDPQGRARTLLASLGLARRADDPVRSYSRGMQQRVALARALVHAPPLLLLDEPATGLDVSARARFHTALHESAADGTTWILVTHAAEEGLALCPRWLFLERGRVADSGTNESPDAERLRERLSGIA